jgi:hypothetical protein
VQYHIITFFTQYIVHDSKEFCLFPSTMTYCSKAESTSRKNMKKALKSSNPFVTTPVGEMAEIEIQTKVLDDR